MCSCGNGSDLFFKTFRPASVSLMSDDLVATNQPLNNSNDELFLFPKPKFPSLAE